MIVRIPLSKTPKLFEFQIVGSNFASFSDCRMKGRVFEEVASNV